MDFIYQQTAKYQQLGKKLRVASQLMQLQHPAGRIKFYGFRLTRLQWDQAAIIFVTASCLGKVPNSLLLRAKEIQKEIENCEKQIRIAELKLKVYGNH